MLFSSRSALVVFAFAASIALVDRALADAPVIHDDGRVTVSLKAPKAESVKIAGGELQRELGSDALAMTKGDDGVWAATIGPLKPGIYDFGFDVDGLRITDPASTHVMGNRTGSRGYLEVPGPKDQPRIDQWRDVPHGTVTQHWYVSKATGKRRSVHVYLPPQIRVWGGPTNDGGDVKLLGLPVVYLLHGSGDDDRHWTELGQAHVIADNLIAEKKCVPMVIVMPEGHPAGGPSNAPRESEERKKYSDENRRLFEQDLLGDVIPLVESHYRVRTDAAGRAIVGLSMGGQQSLTVGLSHVDKFSWIGSFSGAAGRLDDALGKLTADAKPEHKLRLLWIAVGTDDFLLDMNREFVAKLKDLGIEHEYKETAGAHSWSVWRGYLAEFLPRLFKE